MRALLPICLLVILFAPPTFADEEEPTRSSIGEVLARLSVDDPAEQAWGCYLAGRDGYKEAVPQIFEVLGRHTEEPEKLRSLAHRSALDALIRLDARVPDVLLRIHDGHHPVHVLILRSRDPAAHATALLERFDGTLKRKTIGHFGLATGNLLTGIRADGVAVRLLGRLQASLVVKVYTPSPEGWCGGGGGNSARGGFGDGMARVPEGFPPYVWYQLMSKPGPRHELVADGLRPVYVQRRERARSGLAVGGGSLYLDRVDTCLEWIGALLGTDAKELEFRKKSSVYVGWTNADAYLARVARKREGMLGPWWTLIRRLVDARLIDRHEVVDVEPSLQIRIQDDRTDKTDPIPDLPPVQRPEWAAQRK